MAEALLNGTVKWFNNGKGYGFIEEMGTKEDVFVHHTAIQGKGFKSLNEGEQVTFKKKKGDKGWAAVEVHRASE